MRGHNTGLIAMAFGLCAVPAAAQEDADRAATRAPNTATADVFASDDADDTTVVRTGLNLDWSRTSEDEYVGFRLEKAWFTPLGQETASYERAYVRYADRAGGWSWSGQVGTDGHTVLGAFNLAEASRWRKEIFVERDMLETPLGVSEGLYYTFAGAALDIPLSERDTATVLAGVQEFTGDNIRLHLRGIYVHLLKEDWGVSAQLRGRYFHSTDPGEFDYFSPRKYAEVLPVIQMRRFSNGWRFLLAGGYGAQRTSGESWRSARYFNAQASSPANRSLQVRTSLLYSNTPVGNGAVYDYLQGTVGVTTRF